MRKIFLIPGLGADARIYKNIDLKKYDTVGVNWINPSPSDTLESYARKLITQYNIIPGSILIGNSLGGMIAIEIAKRIPLNKTIIISSIKTVQEAPGYFKFFRTFPIYKLIPNKLLTSAGFLIKYVFGHMSANEINLFKSMLKNTSPAFIKWAMTAVLRWKNSIVPDNVYHIAGNQDKVFDYKRIHGATIIEGGTHIMIFDRAQEINVLLERILTS